MKIRYFIASTVFLASTAFADTDLSYVPPTKQSVEIAANLAHQLGSAHIAMIANTHSMLPTLTSEDIIVYKEEKMNNLRVGDIAVFQVLINVQTLRGMRDNVEKVTLCAHRVITKYTGRIKTKGDNNPDVDHDLTDSFYVKGVVYYAVNGQTGEIRVLRN